MDKYVYASPTAEDMRVLARDMREADVLEVTALHTEPLIEIIMSAVEQSVSAWSFRADGELVCIFGIVPQTPTSDVGVLWMLGTDAVDRHALEVTRSARDWLNEAQRVFPRLENYIDARNTRSIAWLKVLGFRFEDPIPLGPFGLPFHRFHKGFE